MPATKTAPARTERVAQQDRLAALIANRRSAPQDALAASRREQQIARLREELIATCGDETMQAERRAINARKAPRAARLASLETTIGGFLARRSEIARQLAVPPHPPGYRKPSEVETLEIEAVANRGELGAADRRLGAAEAERDALLAQQAADISRMDALREEMIASPL